MTIDMKNEHAARVINRNDTEISGPFGVLEHE